MQTVLLHVTGDPAGGYRCELRQCAGRTWRPLAAHDVPADLGAAGAPQLLQDGLAPLSDRIREHVAAHPQSDAFGAIGEHLASLLLRGDTQRRWEELRYTSPEGLRTLLQIEPTDLRLLPWELMTLHRELFVDEQHPVLRARDLGADPAQLLLPLRLLVVEGQHDDRIGTGVEVRAIKRALAESAGHIEAEFLREPSEEMLRRTYERFRPHVFHFIGHGTHVAGSAEPGLRVVDGAQGTTWVLTRRHFLNLLTPAPRVAVLNACRSGEVAAVRDLTDAFFAGGTAAVIGMQGDVKGKAAARFGGELYKAVAREELIDEAVARARKEVYGDVGVVQQERDWFLPSLTVRVPPEQVLPLACALPAHEREGVDLRFASLIDPFVDRVEERHRLVEGIDPEAGTNPGRLIVLAGDAYAGKTRILHWIRRRCALRGRRVKYVDFRGQGATDFLPALCMIRDTAEDVPSLGAHAAAAFARFDYDLTFLAQGKLPAEPEGALPVVDPVPNPAALPDGPVSLIDRTFQSFREALGAATAEQPLVLVLDHLDGLLRPGFQHQLFPRLIRKVVVDGDAPNLRLVVVLSSEQRRDLWPADDARLGRWIDVDSIPLGRYAALAEDLLLALAIDVDVRHEALIGAAAGFVRDPWGLKELMTVRSLVQGMR